MICVVDGCDQEQWVVCMYEPVCEAHLLDRIRHFLFPEDGRGSRSIQVQRPFPFHPIEGDAA